MLEQLKVAVAFLSVEDIRRSDGPSFLFEDNNLWLLVSWKRAETLTGEWVGGGGGERDLLETVNTAIAGSGSDL